MPCTLKDIKMVVSYDDTTIFYFGALGMRNNLAVKVRYRLGSRNC